MSRQCNNCTQFCGSCPPTCPQPQCNPYGQLYPQQYAAQPYIAQPVINAQWNPYSQLLPSNQCNHCSNKCKCKDSSKYSDSSKHSDSGRSGRSRDSDKSGCKCEHKRKKEKKCDKCFRFNCKCIQYFPCLPVRCGFISATLVKSANPTFYTAVGQIITYTYIITNTGTAPICYPISICDDHLGGQFIGPIFIPPGASQTVTRTYTVTPSDLLVQTITNTAVAYIHVKCNKWVATAPSSATITLGSADLRGSIIQTLVGASVNVIVNIINDASSLTAAQNAELVLSIPPNVAAGGIILGVPVAPDTIQVVNNFVVITSPTVAIGATRVFQFSYVPLVVPGAYTWSGTITATTFDPNLANNFLTNTINL